MSPKINLLLCKIHCIDLISYIDCATIKLLKLASVLFIVHNTYFDFCYGVQGPSRVITESALYPTAL